MLNSRQRAKLKSIASVSETPYQMGKGEADADYIKQIDDALEARELIKIKVNGNALHTAKDAARILAKETHSEIVQVIGSKVVLYRKSLKEEKMNISKVIENL